MRHPRVRRPFIVESRGSGRDGNSIAIPKRVQPASQATLKPTDRAAAALFDPWAAVTAPAEAIAAPRRILPNIMTPPEPAPAETEAEAPVQEEARLPRVRRVKPRQPAPVVTQAIPPAPPIPLPALKPVPAPEPVFALPARTASRTERAARAALPAGQRWKARLPRSCW